MPDDQPHLTREAREALRVRLQVAADNLDEFVSQLRAEVITGTEIQMVADEPTPENVDSTLAGIAAIKAEDQLATAAETAKTVLGAEATIAADLLKHQADQLARSVDGLREAVIHLDQRMVIAEERSSLFTERTDLSEKQIWSRNRLTIMVIITLIAVAVAIIALWIK